MPVGGSRGGSDSDSSSSHNSRRQQTPLSDETEAKDFENDPGGVGGGYTEALDALGKRFTLVQDSRNDGKVNDSEPGEWREKSSDHHRHHHHPPHPAISESSSERHSRDSVNPNDSHLISRLIRFKYVKYVNPYRFIKQFGNDEGHEEVATGDDKRKFFCMVMGIKCAQLLVIAGFIFLPSAFPALRAFLCDTHRYWTCIPFGLNFFTVMLARTCTFIRRLHHWFHAAMFFVMTCSYAYFMSSLATYYNSVVIKKVFWVLPGSTAVLAVLPIILNISAVKKMIYIAAFSSVIFLAAPMAFLPPVYEGDSGVELAVDIWLPTVIASEILIFLLIFEFQSILREERIRVLKHDFWFVSLYL